MIPENRRKSVLGLSLIALALTFGYVLRDCGSDGAGTIKAPGSVLEPPKATRSTPSTPNQRQGR
jgi:hypothetical protein